MKIQVRDGERTFQTRINDELSVNTQKKEIQAILIKRSPKTNSNQ